MFCVTSHLPHTVCVPLPRTQHSPEISIDKQMFAGSAPNVDPGSVVDLTLEESLNDTANICLSILFLVSVESEVSGTHVLWRR